MKIKSIGHATDFIFSQYSGNLIAKDGYTVVQTPRNPGFFWGNYLVFEEAPDPGAVERWIAIFEREFPYYDSFNHYAFTWDNETCDPAVLRKFLDRGFEIEHVAVLTTETVTQPTKWNPGVEVCTIDTEQAWEAVIDNQVACSEERYDRKAYRVFKERQFTDYRAMSEQGMGHWYGAYIDGQLVGDLGIFHSGGLARFQNVGTDPRFRRRGVCSTLVYESAKIALQIDPIDRLVMKADDDYFAARIYESVGFRKVEVNHSLCWAKSWSNKP